MKKSKVLCLSLAIISVLSISFGTAVGYLRYQAEKKNVLSVGYNEISVHEDFVPNAEMTAGSNSYKKMVSVENTGTTDSYIRVFVDFKSGDIADVSMIDLTGAQSTYVSEGLPFDDVVSEFESAGYITYQDFKSGDFENNGWVYVPEDDSSKLRGYYYYTEPVSAGSITRPLMYGIMTYFKDALDVKDYEVIVYAESVQVIGNDGRSYEESGGYREAWEAFLPEIV